MAAYHFTSKIHTRAKGASAVRAAAYRAAERLFDERAGKAEDYTRKADVVETAILLPETAPAWCNDRQTLWNAVEMRERRKDSQVAQELEINLPRELADDENWRLITDFCREHMVSVGRICDIAFHVHEATDGSLHPHAHVLMPLREIGAAGFGEKHIDCDWRRFLDRRDRLEELRELWCDFARQRALELGVDLGSDWDHRSFADRGIDLEPQPKIGATAQRLDTAGSPSDRTAEVLAAQHANGERLLRDPSIVLTALTARQSTFTEAELARWVHRHSTDEQFAAIMERARVNMVAIGRDEAGRVRYSTSEMIALEQRMIDSAEELAQRRGHGLKETDRLDGSYLSAEQKDAARHLLQAGDLACLVGYAGAGKSTLLGDVRRELEASGYTVRGATLSGISAEGLRNGSGIEARTVASLFHAWEAGRDKLTAGDVLVIDEAGMIGSRDLAKLIDAAREASARLILVGDPEQLQAIEAGAAFRAISERVGTAYLTEIRRQREDWQREATRDLATGRTADALARYAEAGSLVRTASDDDARAETVARWHSAAMREPHASRIMLAHTRADVAALNTLARDALKRDGLLTDERAVETTNGRRAFASGDRLIFLRNERTLDVRNGTLGTVERFEGAQIRVRTDDGRSVIIDPSSYADVAHGYATTIHKAQGVTVDESFVLASRGFDRHLAYVAMSRHRDSLTLVHSDDAFPNDAELARILGRERAKDTTLDYRQEGPERLKIQVPKSVPDPVKQTSVADEYDTCFSELRELERRARREREAQRRLPGPEL